MNIGIIINPKKMLVPMVVPKLVEWLKSNGNKVMIEEGERVRSIVNKKYLLPLDDLINSANLILALGGDGTLLRAARMVGKLEIPILGVNLGGLGFLTEVTVENLYEVIERVFRNQYKIEERVVLKGEIKEDEEVYGLNDIVVVGKEVGRILQLGIWVEESYVSHFLADGIIISTPTGSTAYSLAALGPIVHPHAKVLIINLICPHTLGVRPMVISDTSEIKIKSESGDAVVIGDGQNRLLLKKGKTLKVRQGDYVVKLIKSGIYDFYSLLRSKLKWG
jgi:NAD+ kinase